MKVPSLGKVAVGLALAAVVVWGASPVMGAGSAVDVRERAVAVQAAAGAGGPAEGDAGAAEEQPGAGGAGETAEGVGETGEVQPAPPWADPERAEKLARLDELERRRARLRREMAELRRELAQVNRELRALRRELWPEGPNGQERDADGEAGAPGGARREWITEEEWERLRRDWQERTERFMEQLHERLRTMGEDLLPWVPDAVVETLAQRTGYTPDEVREMIRTGQWDQLFRRMSGSAEDKGAAAPVPDAGSESDGGQGAEGAPGDEGAEAGKAPERGPTGGPDAALNGTPIT